MRRALIVMLTAATMAAAAGHDAEWLAMLRRWRPQHFGKGASVQGPVDYAALERQWIDAQKRGFGAGSQVYYNNVAHFERIRKMMRPGDVMVFYRTDDRSWNQTGWVIIRSGQVIYDIPGPIAM
jgi:hypothetical protein